MTDEDIYEHLVAVKGIGRWTAEMFLIFSLGRLDILPVGDLGLRAGVKDLDGLAELPDAAAVRRRARNLAALSKYRDLVPVAEPRPHA